MTETNPAPAEFEQFKMPPEELEKVTEAAQELRKSKKESIHWSKISRFEDQPRKFFDQEKMDFLRTTIHDYGQQQDAIVTPDYENPGHYILVDGERRWRAAREDDAEVECKVLLRKLTNDERFLLSTLCNMHHAEHTILEKANSMQRLYKRNGLTQKQIADIFGCTYATVANHLVLLEKLHSAVIDLLDPTKHEKILGLMAAVELTAFYNQPERQLYLARKILADGMTLQKAKRFLQKEAKKAKIKVGRGRERRPSDYLETLASVLVRIEFGLDPLLDMKRHEFEERFKHLQPMELRSMAKKIGEGADSLLAIKDFFDTLLRKMLKPY